METCFPDTHTQLNLINLIGSLGHHQKLTHCWQYGTGRVIFFPINATGMGRFQLLNLGVLGYGLELRFWVVIAIIVSLTLTLTINLITTLTII